MSGASTSPSGQCAFGKIAAHKRHGQTSGTDSCAHRVADHDERSQTEDRLDRNRGRTSRPSSPAMPRGRRPAPRPERPCRRSVGPRRDLPRPQDDRARTLGRRGVRPVGVHSDHEIDALLNHVDGPVLRRYLQSHLRIFVGEARREPAHHGLENSRGALTRRRPRGRSPPEAIAAAASSNSVAANLPARTAPVLPASASDRAYPARTGASSSWLPTRPRVVTTSPSASGRTGSLTEPTMTSDEGEVGQGEQVHRSTSETECPNIAAISVLMDRSSRGHPNCGTQRNDPMTILVTGATGRVGRHVVQHLTQRGASVAC